MKSFRSKALRKFSTAVQSVSSTDAPQVNLSEVTTTKTNGIRCVSRQGTTGNSVCSLRINAGTRDETYDNAGVSHFIKRLFFAPSNLQTQLSFINGLQQSGADIRVEHGREDIVYTVEGNESAVTGAVSAFVEQIEHGRLLDWDLTPKRQRVAYDIEASLEDPQVVVSEALHDVAFSGEGLGQPLVAPAYSVNGMTIPKILTFMDQNMVKENFTLSATGVSHQSLEKMADEIFYGIDVGTANTRPQSQYTGGYKMISEHRFSGGESQTYTALAFRGQSRGDNSGVSVLTELLGNGSNTYEGSLRSAGRVQRNVVDQTPEINRATSFQNTYSDAGIFGVYFESEGGESMQPAFKNYIGQLQALAKGNFSKSELEGAKNRSLRNLYNQTGTPSGIVDYLQESQTTVKHDAQKISHVDATAVQRAAQVALDSKPSIVSFGKTGGVPKSL